MRIIKCSNTYCHERFRLHEVRQYYNDYGFVVLRCKICGALTKIRVPNPEYYGYFENATKVTYWEHGDQNQYDNVPEGESLDIFTDVQEAVLCPWVPSIKPLWGVDDENYERAASEAKDAIRATLLQEYSRFQNYYLANTHVDDITKSFVIQHYLYHGIPHTAVWAKQISNENDINPDGLYLIYHDDVPMEKIDGIFTRDEILLFLQRCLLRWRFLCSQVIVVTPFIGFFYKNRTQQEETVYLWKMLNELLDISKTIFVTRKATYTQLKNSQTAIGEADTDFLREWGLFDNLQEAANNNKLYFVQKFHAKFYAGVFPDRVEMISGSYNIQTGSILEQVCIKSYSREDFANRYLRPLIPDFQYMDDGNDHVHQIIVEQGGGIRNNNDTTLHHINEGLLRN